VSTRGSQANLFSASLDPTSAHDGLKSLFVEVEVCGRQAGVEPDAEHDLLESDLGWGQSLFVVPGRFSLLNGFGVSLGVLEHIEANSVFAGGIIGAHRPRPIG
jgi:hypothetical protein